MLRYMNPDNGQIVAFPKGAPVPPKYVLTNERACANCSLSLETKARKITPIDKVDNTPIDGDEKASGQFEIEQFGTDQPIKKGRRKNG